MAREEKERMPREIMCEQVLQSPIYCLQSSQSVGFYVACKCRLEAKRVVANLKAADGLETISSDVSFWSCASVRLPTLFCVRPMFILGRTSSGCTVEGLVAVAGVDSCSVSGGSVRVGAVWDGLLLFVSRSSVMLDDSDGWCPFDFEPREGTEGLGTI